MTRLHDKVAVVTGASAGIGAATAIALAAEGAVVAAIARRADRLDALVARIRTSGGRAHAYTADLSVEADAQQAIERIRTDLGRIDILVNNAGAMAVGAIAAVDTDEWRAMFDINVHGMLYATKASLVAMRAQGGGHVVNISSVLGKISLPGNTGYGMTKAAINSFSEGLRKEVLKEKIRVTVIAPGGTVSEITSSIRNPELRKASDTFRARLTLLEAEDIAAAVIYAVSQPDRVSIGEIIIRPSEQEI